VREREKSSEAKSSQNNNNQKEKKGENSRVIFDVKAFFSILISREESQLQSASETPQNKNKSSSNLTYINNVCGWD
jgi:hypothetical protein